MKRITILIVLLVFSFACSENNEVTKSTIEQNAVIQENSERMGLMFYERVNYNALEDPLKDLSGEERQTFSEKFEKLKAKESVSAKDVLDEQLSTGVITQTIHDGILQYNDDLTALIEQTPESAVVLSWCLDKEDAIKKQNGLTMYEKSRLLTHHVIIRNYVKATFETLPDDTKGVEARVESWKSILCYVGCAIDNITAFAAVGSYAGQYGEIIGAAVGLIYTIVGGSTACPNCASSAPPCQYATSISSNDVCYSASAGKTFTAWGYGSTPLQFAWDFYNYDNLNVPFFTWATSTDSYTLTDSQIGGRTKIAVRLRSNCSGTYQNSQYLWFGITDAGKPRPVVLVTEMGGNLVRYTLSGTNNSNPTWSFIPAYRGSLTAGSYSSGTITIQWVSNQMRIGANVTTTSACGTTSATAH